MRSCRRNSYIGWLGAALVLVMLFAVGDADAKKRRGRKKRRAVATKASIAAVKKLMGQFKWGQGSDEVVAVLEKQVRAAYEPKIKAERDALLQDRLRKRMFEDLAKVKKGKVAFTGKRTPWDVSLVEKEFAHKNSESMVVRWTKRDRRFYFFHHGRLWKIYIAFNSDLFQGKTFGDFQRVMERRFGPAEAKWKLDLRGKSQMSHVEWPPVGRTVLLALDETTFYGNFCLVLIDKKAAKRVRQARILNSPKRKYSDPLVDAAIRKPGNVTDPNSDVVDKLTGKRRELRRPAPRERAIRPGEVAPRTRRTGKGKEGDPLSGLDI